MRSRWAIVALGLAIAGCGGSEEPDRFTLRTPGADPGAPLTPTPEPTASPRPAPEPARRPVSRAEQRVIRGWADALRRGRVSAAARYFSVPSRVSNVIPGWLYLETQTQVQAFNASLPCGARLLRTRRSAEPGFVIGIFRLTERPGPGSCGTGTGSVAAVAFRISSDHHITSWVRADAEIDGPAPSPTPSATEPRTDSA